MSKAPPAFEPAEFTDAQAPRPRRRARWTILISVLALLFLLHGIARDVIYKRLLHKIAQGAFNGLASASIQSIGDVSVDALGDVSLHRAVVTTERRGHRVLIQADLVRLTFDGQPLRDRDLRVMRVDLVRPQIYARRERDGEWNLEWALRPAATPGEPEEGGGGDGFPRNGVHVHDGTIHVAFADGSGKDVIWRTTGVRASVERRDGLITVRRCAGDFYGGRIRADAEIPGTSPLRIRQLKADVRDADVSRMAEGAPWLKHPIRGRFNAVFALSLDPSRTGARPIMAGRCEINDGDLWPLPAFSGILHTLTLTSVEDKRIDEAQLAFTVEEGRVRVDQMHFLGYPVSLFGDGAVSLTGDWMDIRFVPRLGKKDWNSILPIIGAPIDLLSNIVKGALVPVSLTGSFSEPRFRVGAEGEAKPDVRRLIEEKSPR
ncbi:MAG TPA: hypothetical protein VF950_26560 [Planctomycetota bacterium]